MAQGKLYVIGGINHGVLFVKTRPFKAVLVPHSAIEKYISPTPPRYGYAKVAAAAWQMISKSNSDIADIGNTEAIGIESLVGAGTKVTNAEFAFVADIEDGNWDVDRTSVQIIHDALEIVAPDGKVEYPDLAEAVLGDN